LVAGVSHEATSRSPKAAAIVRMKVMIILDAIGGNSFYSMAASKA
jgi:hypothetical protein